MMHPDWSRVEQEAVKAKSVKAGVNVEVLAQLLTSLDYDRLRRDAKSSLVVTVGEASVTVDHGKDYFWDARSSIRERKP